MMKTAKFAGMSAAGPSHGASRPPGGQRSGDSRKRGGIT